MSKRVSTSRKKTIDNVKIKNADRVIKFRNELTKELKIADLHKILLALEDVIYNAKCIPCNKNFIISSKKFMNYVKNIGLDKSSFKQMSPATKIARLWTKYENRKGNIYGNKLC